MSPILGSIAGASARGYGLFSTTSATSSFESIATFTASGGETSFTFSSIPQNYKHLQIRGIARNNSGSGTDNLYIRFNADTGNNYTTHWLQGDGATASASSVSPWNLQLVGFIPASGSTANSFAATITDIQDYASTTKNKTVRYFTGNDRNGSGDIFLGSSSWMNTNAITTISLNCSNDFALGSTFALYGIK